MTKSLFLLTISLLIGSCRPPLISPFACYSLDGNALERYSSSLDGTLHRATEATNRLNQAAHALYFDGNDFIDQIFLQTLTLLNKRFQSGLSWILLFQMVYMLFSIQTIMILKMD